MIIDVEEQVSEVFDKHELPKDFLRRYKHPSGRLDAAIGLVLFYPPDTVPLDVRTTFHRGSFAMDGFFDAGLTDVKLFVLDRYPFSTAIPYGRSIGYRPFTLDPMQENATLEPEQNYTPVNDLGDVFFELPAPLRTFGTPATLSSRHAALSMNTTRQ